MADKRVTVTIEAIDKASSTIKSIGSQLSSLGKLGDIKGLSNLGNTVNGIGKAFSSIKGKAGLAVTGITMAVSGFNKLYTASKQSFIDGISKIGNVCKTIVSGLLGAGKAFLSFAGNVANADLSFAGLAKTSMNYDQTIARIGVKAGATKGEMSKLGSTIKKLTVDTVFSMDEIAGAAEYMVQNGRTASQVIEELGAVTGLATVGNVDLARSADIVASTMNMFSRQNLTAAQVANLFAKAANTSGANVENLAKSLENCGPQAAALNIPFEQLMATLATMGDNAIKGGKAGTALKNLFQRMAAPTKEAATAIEKYNLQTAQAKIVSGDLKGGLLEMKKALDLNKISSNEQQKAVKQLAGAYGSAGLTSVLNTATDELMVTFEAMEKGLVTTGDLDKGMNKLMSTIQGQVMRFSANVQLAFYNLYTQANSSIAKVMDVFNNFLSMLNSGTGIQSALKYLETEFNKLPKILSNAIENGIKGVNNFINGGSLDSILSIGTSIIDGITSGIDKAYKNGTLVNSISGIISKVCDWIKTNGPKIEKAGTQILDALKQGIEKNKDKIKSALNTVIRVMNSWAKGSTELKSLCGTFAQQLIDGLIEQVGIKAKRKANEFKNSLFSMLVPTDTPDMTKGGTGLIKKITDWLFGESYAAEVETKGKETGQNLNKGLDSTKTQTQQTGNAIGKIFGQNVVQSIQQAQSQLNAAFTGIQNSARNAFMGLANITRNQFTNACNIVRNQCVNMADIVRNQCVNMANIFRNQFVSMSNVARNQMVSVSNIIRNQAVSWGNVIRNQVQNARNAFTRQFISMAAVARTQMVNVSNVIRNQAVGWSNVIRNQASNARNALTSSFMSMAAVARTQMAHVLSVVRSYMSQIAAACNKTLTLKVNINKTETTTKKVVVEGGGKTGMMNIAVPQTSSFTASGTRGASNSIGLGSLAQVLSGYGKDQTISISVPVVLEGREIAKASAIYTREELSRLEKRNNRKRGE